MRLLDLPFRKGDAGSYPLIPLKDVVVFPHVVSPLFLGKKSALEAVSAAGESGKLFLVLQREEAETHTPDTLHRVGTVVTLLQTMKLPDGTKRILVEGKQRARLRQCRKGTGYQEAVVEPIDDEQDSKADDYRLRAVREAFQRLGQSNKKLPQEVSSQVERAENPHKVANLVAAHTPMDVDKKQSVLELGSGAQRLDALAELLEAELELLEFKKDISGRVKKRIEKSQRDYFLKEQRREINKELGEEDDDPSGAAELERRIREKQLPESVRTKAEKELKRLSKLQAVSPEAGIVRTYLEWIVDLPWNERTDDRVEIDAARAVLDTDHYDMERPKTRILEYIAVRQLTQQIKGPILCFVGPPGTGKTSLGHSLARALGREFIRISLGGVRDEAEIRGHRRTYVGALPGKIIQSMRRAGSKNPVFLLDEIDKMSSDFRGDPASALLEVLDPEQNSTFVDHYLEVQYDLSEVMFLTTANTIHTVPYALRDRMEIIEVPGYTEFEKRKIATGFLVPKQLKANGLSFANITFRSDALTEIIRNYTMESGVRNLEREIATVARKIAVETVQQGYRPPESVHPPAAESGEAEHPTAGDDRSAEEHSPPENVPGSNEADNDEPGSYSQSSRLEGEAEVHGHSDAMAPRPAQGHAVQQRSENGGEHAGERGASYEAGSGAPARAAHDIDHLTLFRRSISAATVRKYLGKKKYRSDLISTETRPGLAYGLAWTELGGRLLPVEATVFDGNGTVLLTGSLGDVMKESAHTALSFIRAYRTRFHLPEGFSKDKDIHVHVPEGAIPKDGPSAGITLMVAILSAFTKIAPHAGVAMTGEITLTGRLLSVGGIKEKALAAHRNKLNNVLLPVGNRDDTDELPQEVTSDVTFYYADTVIEAISRLFSPELFEVRPF